MTTRRIYNRLENQEELRRAEQEFEGKWRYSPQEQMGTRAYADKVVSDGVVDNVVSSAETDTKRNHHTPADTILGSEDGFGEVPLMFQGHWYDNRREGVE